jgi:uncharacterized protein YbjT (DUF2867 family)
MDEARKGPVVAVTGATGFLGRRLVKVLAQQGWTVRVLARRDIADPAWSGLEPQLVIGDLASAAPWPRCATAPRRWSTWPA